MEKIFWKAYTRGARHHTLSRLQFVIAQHGDLIDVRFFSDIAVSMIIEIRESRMNTLYEQLREQVQMDNVYYVQSGLDKERVLFFNLTFSNATGDLLITVPAVPG